MDVIYAPEDFIGILQKLPAWWGQHDATTDTIEETGVELLLQLTDLDRHGRLRVAERLRRLRKALHLYDFYKRSQLTNFHKGLLLTEIFHCIVFAYYRREGIPKQVKYKFILSVK